MVERRIRHRSTKPEEKMERETGIEPATSSLGSWRSTAELLPLSISYQSLPSFNPAFAKMVSVGSKGWFHEKPTRTAWFDSCRERFMDGLLEHLHLRPVNRFKQTKAAQRQAWPEVPEQVSGLQNSRWTHRELHRSQQ